MSALAFDPSRRDFLAAGGALIVSFSIPLWARAAEEKGELPGSLKKAPWLDAWIRIDDQGAVTVFTGKAELGQGIKTALIQLTAEELVVRPERVAIVTADTERTADEGYTAGSHSMQDSGTAIRNAAAQVRELLISLAAQKLGAARETLTVADGAVRGGGKSVPYGELVSGEVLHVQASPESKLRDPASHIVVGQPMQRVDIPAKVSGGLAYVQDLRMQGMAHGRVVRPPSPAATLREVDSRAVEKMPGILRVVRDGSFLAVIAEREYQCVQAAQALSRAARWDERESLPASAEIYDWVLHAQTQDSVIGERGTLDVPGRKFEATYARPFQIHGSIGPSCAVAKLEGGKYTVWTHSQGVYPLRGALAELVGADEKDVHCIQVEGSGCYGHNAADDVAADATLLARALPGRPVRVQWMRQDEHGWEPFGPPMVMKAAATLDAGGDVRAWQYEVWSPPHDSRPGRAGNLLAGKHLAKPFPPKPVKPIPQPDGGGDRNAIPLYAFPNLRVVHHFIAEAPLRVSALRSLGAYANVFALESFMDELAAAARADPVAFRLRHLRDERARAVVTAAQEKFGWRSFARSEGRGRGFAFAQYKNQAGYFAIACEVEADQDTGIVRLLRAVAAVDCGEAVNPDGIRNQVEGGIVQSASWTLTEALGFDRTRVTSRDWGAYPILRFPHIPQSIEVEILDRPGKPFLGLGEVAQGPTSAAIANALADATGVRLRELPFSRSRVRAIFSA